MYFLIYYHAIILTSLSKNNTRKWVLFLDLNYASYRLGFEEKRMSNFTWNSTVRAHEIDAQGIVNNAHYLSYFDHTRTLHLLEHGFDWVKLAKEGFNFVLIEANLKFLHPLRPFEAFNVSSNLTYEGRLKLIFNQTITNAEQVICRGINTVVCVNSRQGKPIAINKVPKLHLDYATLNY